jgi:hypothetical protein
VDRPQITEDRRGWHWDKGIPLATIFAIVVTYTSLVAWVVQSQAAMDRRIQFNEYVIGEILTTRKELLARYDKKFDKFESEIEAIKDKMRKQ